MIEYLTCLLQLMILVDDAGDFLPTINHSPWNGVTLADFVMPFFLFIVGVALALAYKVSLPNKAQILFKCMLMSKNYAFNMIGGLEKANYDLL